MGKSGPLQVSMHTADPYHSCFVQSVDTTVSALLFVRWWPAEVSNPQNIPENILRMRHDVGEFPVLFFGSNDYLWTYQARVFPYMEGDANSKEKMGKGVDSTYKKGISSATNYCCLLLVLFLMPYRFLSNQINIFS